MRIAFCGAHRTGKTTLVNALASVYSIKPIKTTTSQVFIDNNLDPSEHYSFEQRMSIQLKILDSLNNQYLSGGDNFVTDRTPFDALAYTLADVNNRTVNSDFFEDYTLKCLNSIKQFHYIFLIPPSITIVPEQGKSSLNPAYIEHIHCTLQGLLIHHNVPHILIPKSIKTVDQRLSFILNKI